MEVINTSLDGVKLIKPPTIFEDFRGSYIEIYNEEIYNEYGIKEKFIQDDISTSGYRVLRGLHGDNSTTKLITCLKGAFYLVVVNNDQNSPQYHKWTSITLSESNRLQVLIPAGFANGHLVMSEQAIFHYKQTTTYNRASQFTILWNDPNIGIWWPLDNPILSKRDQGVEL